MLKRITILVATAIPLNWMTDYWNITLLITAVQCIIYFIYELFQINKAVPLYVPFIFGLISSVHVGGKFIAWLTLIILPKDMPIIIQYVNCTCNKILMRVLGSSTSKTRLHGTIWKFFIFSIFSFH